MNVTYIMGTTFALIFVKGREKKREMCTLSIVAEKVRESMN